jgi:hypothetical protein
MNFSTKTITAVVLPLVAISVSAAQVCWFLDPCDAYVGREKGPDDYVLIFEVPNSTDFKLVGRTGQAQRVINTAIAQGGIQENNPNYRPGIRRIKLVAGGRARWGNLYFGSIQNWRSSVYASYK